MLIILLSSIALVLAILQTRTIRERIEKQGLAIAENLAAISLDYLVTYNYVALEKLANQAADNPGITHVIIHDKEGKIAGHSKRPDLQNKLLTDDISKDAVEAESPTIIVHSLEKDSPSVMDVTVPVYLPDSRDRWGTIRVCLSLDLMRQQNRQTLWTIFILGSVALIIGMLISNWAAQRVTRPLEVLVDVTMEAAQGNLKQDISIHTRDEVEILASNFSDMIREILAQKLQLENQLYEIKRLQHYTEEILSTMKDGLLAVDMDGVVMTINPAARNLLDINPDQGAIGSSILDFYDKGTPIYDYINTSLTGPSGGDQREIHLQKGEDTRILLTDSNILESDGKNKKQVIFNFNDMTALKKLEAQVRQGQRLADLGTMAAGMAHEIRNPLSAIKTYVALLPKKIGKTGFLEKFQRTVPREINRLNTLIEELLELSRPPRYNFKLTGIQTLLMQSIDLLEADLRLKGIDCQWDIPHDLPPIMADVEQLEKVFINLIQNGAQAMSGGGKISIYAAWENDWLTLEFKDTGLGFSSELAENIFNPFFTTKAKGTGLGLAITHKVISEHGGHITVTSKKDAGSCFSIRLPGTAH